mgnify:FL=1
MSSDALSVGKQLVELCRQGKNLEAIDKLYAPNIVSIEAMSMPEMPARQEGIEAIRGKNQWWLANHEVHSEETSGPFPHGDRFAVFFKIDVTNKPSGQRMQMEEVGLYTVKNGKVVQEEYFYDMPGA